MGYTNALGWRPTGAKDIGRIQTDREIRINLTADREATVHYATLTKTSRDGRPMKGAETVIGIGNHFVELSGPGGHVELAAEVGGDRVIDFTTDDEGPLSVMWSFVADGVWSGGSINEEATEIARMREAGLPLPNRERGPGLPPKAEPAMPLSITRPWAPEKDSLPIGE